MAVPVRLQRCTQEGSEARRCAGYWAAKNRRVATPATVRPGRAGARFKYRDYYRDFHRDFCSKWLDSFSERE
jgi:hypothetical protein